MFKFGIYLVLLMITSCSSNEMRTSQKALVFGEYVDKFEYFYGKPIPDILIILTNLDKFGNYNATGLCKRHNKDSKLNIIYIDEVYWNRMSDAEQEMLIFHELGHCVLYKDHNNAKMLNGCPMSLMYPSNFSQNCYAKFYKHYLKDLFYE